MVQRKAIYQFVDYRAFKVIGVAATVILYAVIYYFLRFPADLGLNSVVGLVFPGVMVLLWECLKRRQFWWFWLAGSLLCAIGARLFGSLEPLLIHGYWLVSLIVCICLAVAPSKTAVRLRERKREDAVVFTPKSQKDEFLEQLFADQ